MMMPMQKPTERTWEDMDEELIISIANTEKNLLIMKAQQKEVRSHIKEK